MAPESDNSPTDPPPVELDSDRLRKRISGARSIFVAGGMAYPAELVRWLNDDPRRLANKDVVFAQPAGFSQPPVRASKGRVRTFFHLPSMAGLEEYELVPMQYRGIADWLAERGRFDLVLAQVAPVGDDRYSAGLGVDFLPSAMHSSRVTVVEVNESLPAPIGAPTWRSEEFEVVARSRVPPVELPVAAVDSTTASIARHVAGLVEDGDCLQLGIGAIPSAILASLGEHRDLGVHSGMISDGVMRLMQRGVITNRRKEIDRGLTVTGFLLGTPQLYDWARGAQDLRLRPASYTHDSRVLADLENLVSINSAIEIDLCGQVNAERIRGRTVSGVGGSIDFMRAAARSPRGRSILALPATAAGGKVSRIVRQLAPEAVVTAPRTDVDIVVTEHGVAQLRGASERERVERLIAIAAPEFRGELAG